MQQPHEESNFSMTLREHLLNSQAQQSLPPPPPHHDSSHSPPRHEHHIDPAISPPNYNIMSHEDEDANMEDQSPDVRKGRRELSTSKRAAQNRAAQRAFRQRKEAYINSLQEKVREYEGLIGNYKAIQQENFQLREYIIQLQSKLIGDVPPAPGNIDLHHPPDRPVPRSPTPQHHVPAEPIATQPVAPMSSEGAEQLRAAAVAAAQAAVVDEHGQSRSRANSDPDAAAIHMLRTAEMGLGESHETSAAPSSTTTAAEIPGESGPTTGAQAETGHYYTDCSDISLRWGERAARIYPVPYARLRNAFRKEGREFEEHLISYPSQYADLMVNMLTEEREQ